MGLDRREVLFGQFLDNLGGVERINKKLQIVDIPAMEALRNIMQVVQLEPAFNGEGKLIARSVDIDRGVFRVHNDDRLIQQYGIPRNTGDTVTDLKVVGLDYRLSRVDFPFQKVLTIPAVHVGVFNPVIEEILDYTDDRTYRVVPWPTAKNIQTQGTLLAHIFKLDDNITVTVEEIDDFSCKVRIELHGVWIAILIITYSLALYISLRIIADHIGAATFWNSVIAFALDAIATVLLFLVMQMMTAIGTLSCEIWGTPFEYVYREIEAKARVADILIHEAQEETVTNHIIGELADAEALAFALLRRRIAESAGRTITLSNDFLLEPNDVLELPEGDDVARIYVLQVDRSLERGSTSPTIGVTGFRVR